MAGNIRRRGKNAWQVTYELPADPSSGQRRRRSVTVRGLKKDAEQKLAELIRLRDTGFELAPAKLTLADYLQRWLRDYARVNVAPSTFARYEIAVRKHLIPHLGAHKLAAVRPVHIQELHATCLAEGLSPRTVHQHHRILSEALRHAVEWQLLPANPAQAVRAPRFQRHEMPVLDEAGVRTLLTSASDTFLKPLIYLALHTGARNGELLALRWSDIDLDRGRMSIVRTAQRVRGEGIIFGATKTHRSRRALSLSPDAVKMLREQRAKQNEQRLSLGPVYQDHGLVFAQPTGRPYEPGQISKAFANLLERAGLPRMRFHDLRHTSATLLLTAGVHPKIVSERLGHATVNITLDTYSHLLPDLQREAADAMDKVLAGTVSTP